MSGIGFVGVVENSPFQPNQPPRRIMGCGYGGGKDREGDYSEADSSSSRRSSNALFSRAAFPAAFTPR